MDVLLIDSLFSLPNNKLCALAYIWGATVQASYKEKAGDVKGNCHLPVK
jgi:hypothetical protein